MDEPAQDAPEATPDAFRPSIPRAAFAFILAAGSFFIPQEIPLEWYPLNNPGNDINYLEISCASDKTGEVQIFENLTRGINQLDSIRFPIGPSKQSFTYTFPLPDAPLLELRVDPPSSGAEFFVRQMRIINRRDEEIQRFTREEFQSLNQIASLRPEHEGWTFISTPDSSDPFARISLAAPIVPVDMNHRNLLRCLLSTGYLSMMLLILLLAVSFAFYKPVGWLNLAKHIGFLAFLAVIFAIVGNRGLIRNSIHYARFVVPPLKPGLQLELDVNSSSTSNVQLFWDFGTGISQDQSVRLNYEPHSGLQTIRFPLPSQPVRALRFDPREGGGKLRIRAIKIADSAGRLVRALPLDSLTAEHDIESLEVKDNILVVTMPPNAADPILMFKSAQVDAINQLQSRSSAH